MPPEEAPVVGYTVKELLARMEGKIDAYATRHDATNEIVRRIEPEVRDHEARLSVLELGALAKGAIRTWQSNIWRGVVSVAAVGSAAAIIIQLSHLIK